MSERKKWTTKVAYQAVWLTLIITHNEIVINLFDQQQFVAVTKASVRWWVTANRKAEQKVNGKHGTKEFVDLKKDTIMGRQSHDKTELTWKNNVRTFASRQRFAVRFHWPFFSIILLKLDERIQILWTVFKIVEIIALFLGLAELSSLRFKAQNCAFEGKRDGNDELQ